MLTRIPLLNAHSIYCAVILFSFYQSAYSQVDLAKAPILNQEQFIKGCANYRARLLHDLEDGMISFGHLADSLAMTSSIPDAHQKFMVSVLKSMLPENGEMDPGSALKSAKEILNNDQVAMVLYKEWYEKNGIALFELSFLVNEGLIEEAPPYKLNKLKILWEEFSFYQIKEGMSIADIGAGTGFLSFILVESGLPLQLTLTEIDDDFLSILTSKVGIYSREFPGTPLALMRAQETSLGLGNKKIDCMILREVFHHMKDQDAILADVRKHLNPEGTIILRETTEDSKLSKKELCVKATTYAKLTKSFSKAGFQLVDEKVVDDAYLLRFKMRA